MSLYEELPVYKAALDMAIYFEKVVRNFERYHKYTFGAEIRTLAHKILILVAKANTKQARKESLAEALDKLEELKITLRLCKEVKAFNSFKSFEFATKSVIEVSKQCEGWLRSLNSCLGHFRWADSYHLTNKLISLLKGEDDNDSYRKASVLLPEGSV